MSYSRWDKLDWYIFWQDIKAKRKTNEKLIIYYKKDLEAGVQLTYKKVKQILKSNNFASIPYSKGHKTFLKKIFKRWIKDVDYYYDYKTIYRKCVTCGKRLRIKVFKDKKYEGGVYFGKLEIPDYNSKCKVVGKSKIGSLVDYERYKKVEYWECYDCAKKEEE